MQFLFTEQQVRTLCHLREWRLFHERNGWVGGLSDEITVHGNAVRSLVRRGLVLIFKAPDGREVADLTETGRELVD